MWGTTSVKGVHGEGNWGEVAGMELRWWYGMSNRTK